MQALDRLCDRLQDLESSGMAGPQTEDYGELPMGWQWRRTEVPIWEWR